MPAKGYTVCSEQFAAFLTLFIVPPNALLATPGTKWDASKLRTWLLVLIQTFPLYVCKGWRWVENQCATSHSDPKSVRAQMPKFPSDCIYIY